MSQESQTTHVSNTPSPIKFNFHAKSVFLTYPQTGDLTKEQFLEYFKSFLPLDKYVISRETHTNLRPDGQQDFHIHAVLTFTKKWRTRRSDAFDFNGRHPNIQQPRSTKNAAQYTRKHGDFIAQPSSFGLDEPTFPDLIKRCSTRTEFLNAVLESPSLCRSWSSAVGIAGYAYGERVEAYTPDYPRDSFTEPPKVSEWVNRFLTQVNTSC